MRISSPPCTGILVLLSATALAQPVAISPDIDVELSGTTFFDEEAVADSQTGLVGMVPLGVLPERSDLNGYHLFPDGDQLYSLDTASEVGGGLVVSAADVVRYDGTNDSLEFDASAEGVPDGVVVDAVSVHDSGDLMLSFDTSVELGRRVTVGDEDLVRFDGVDFTVFFDGSALSLASALDLDGADFRASDGHLLLSFDGSGSIGGVDFQDEDILDFDPVGVTWSLHYDGSVLHASLEAADVIAVPEPGGWLPLGSAIALLLALRRSSRPYGKTDICT